MYKLARLRDIHSRWCCTSQDPKQRVFGRRFIDASTGWQRSLADFRRSYQVRGNAQPQMLCSSSIKKGQSIQKTGLRVSAGVSAGSEQQIEKLHDTTYLEKIKWNEAGLVTVIVQAHKLYHFLTEAKNRFHISMQDIDTGEVLMQAYSDAAGIQETLQTRLATFYSRSRQERWCKGETSGNFITVSGVYLDCDRDSIIYLGDPCGPSCHTGSHTCWFSEAAISGSQGNRGVHELTNEAGRRSSPLSSILALEETIAERKAEGNSSEGGKKSWTAKLLQNPELLCSKIREEAGELCETLEKSEGKERAASEMADLLYHSMVLLNLQGVSYKDVSKVLRGRFGTSGIDEKLARLPKQ